MSLQALGEQLAATPLSEYLQEQLWIVPVSQSIHIISIGVVFAAAIIISLRLLGVGNSGRSVSQLVRTLVPWMYSALGVLLFTGIVQTVIEPVRQFVTPQFWWKMCMILTVMILTVTFARAVRRNSPVWDDPKSRPGSGKVFAVVSLALWISIIICGRLIGYTWSFYVS